MQIGLIGLLTIIFVIAKLAGIITWSWWVVFSPVGVGLIIATVWIIVIGLIIAGGRN